VDLRFGWDLALAALLLSLALCMLIAWVYVLTYQGLSYLRGFTQTLATAGIISALVMMAIGSDIGRGVGLVGALTLIRFRSTLKDTRDLLFVFASLIVGVACGVFAFGLAIIGTVVFCVAISYVSWSSFGSRREFNAILKLQIPADPLEQRVFVEVLQRYCHSFALINLRDAGLDIQEHSYHLSLTKPDAKVRLIHDLGGLPGVGAVSLLMQDTALEL
jgi:Domain of unknown function (DUF4956)